MTRILWPLAATLVLLAACADPPGYAVCPAGVDPSTLDCIPRSGTFPGPDAGADTDPDVQPGIDTPGPGPGPGPCVPECGRRECGEDGCGGTCGTCPPDGFCDESGYCVTDLPLFGTCEDTLECVAGCDDTVCAQWCYDNSTPDAAELARGAYDCVINECAWATTERELQRCQIEVCGDWLDACFQSQAGTLECPEALDCMMSCDDERCIEECGIVATASAQYLLGEFFNCAQQRCRFRTIGELIQCGFDECPDAVNACFDIEPQPPTPGRCGSGFEVPLDELSLFAHECGQACRFDTGEVDFECATDCMSSLGVEWECAECGAEFATCQAYDCGRRCADPTDPACFECLELSGCYEQFNRCAFE